MEHTWIEPGATDPGYTDEQLRRAQSFAEQDFQASRMQLQARFGLGDICAEIIDLSGTAAAAVHCLEPLSRQLGYAAATLDRYRRVTQQAGTQLRGRLTASAVHVPWKCVVIACITDPAEQTHRVGLLLGRLASAERAGWPTVLDAGEYARAVGLADGVGSSTGDPGAAVVAQLHRDDVRKAVVTELTKSPEAVLAVLREPTVREVLQDREVARYVREQMRPPADPDDALLDELIGAADRDPRADWTIRYFDLAHKCREILLLGPDDFADVDDPDVWQSVESIRSSVVSWADRVLEKRPRAIRLLSGR